MLPLIMRELHAEARHSFTYWMRILGAGALLLVGAYYAFHVPTAGAFFMPGRTGVFVTGGTGVFITGGTGAFSINQGGPLFARLHLTLLCSIWLLVPLVTADCISRERREGTLGLLFLTPLTARQIVLAKGLAHGLRAMTLCLAVLPILTIPFLMGGVSWQESFLSVAFNLSSFCWALAAGLLASSWTKSWLRALFGAMLIAIIFGLSLGWLNCFLISSAVPSFAGIPWSLEPFSMAAFVLATDVNEFWKLFWAAIPTASQSDVLRAAGSVAALSLITLACILQIAARNVRRRWREEPPSAQRLWLERTFTTPVFWLAVFRRWMRWKLNRNPIGWLEQRSWTSRLVTWIWLAVMISLLSIGLGGVHIFFNAHDFEKLEALFAWLLAGSIALSAAGSFRRERETGLLELLLVSPLRVSQIISGRLRGLWGQFLPAVLLLFGSWLYLGSAFGDGLAERIIPIVSFSITFLILPVVGLYYSLCQGNFISTLLKTIGVGIVIPVLAGQFASFYVFVMGDNLWGLQLSETLFGGGPYNLVTIALQIAIARFLLSRLQANLTQRHFALQLMR